MNENLESDLLPQDKEAFTLIELLVVIHHRHPGGAAFACIEPGERQSAHDCLHQ